MELNYHHLYYFWSVAKEGSVIGASEKLGVSQPTISAQLKSLEESFGTPLFARSGRGLILTEVGKTVLKYSEEIFATGREMLSALGGISVAKGLQVKIGVSDVLPKLLVSHVIYPLFKQLKDIKVICIDGKAPDLLSKLALHDLDMVLLDEIVPTNIRIKAFSHLLGESPISFLAPKSMAVSNLNFPACLMEKPLLLPTQTAVMRGIIDDWAARHNLKFNPLAEFEDTLLMKQTASLVGAIFPVPKVMASIVCEKFNAKEIGTVDHANVHYYAVSLERRVRHPAVSVIAEKARGELFSNLG